MSLLIFCSLNKRFIISAFVDFSLDIKHKIIKIASYTTEFLNDVTRGLRKNLKCETKAHLHTVWRAREPDWGSSRPGYPRVRGQS